ELNLVHQAVEGKHRVANVFTEVGAGSRVERGRGEPGLRLVQHAVDVDLGGAVGLAHGDDVVEVAVVDAGVGGEVEAEPGAVAEFREGDFARGGDEAADPTTHRQDVLAVDLAVALLHDDAAAGGPDPDGDGEGAGAGEAGRGPQVHEAADGAGEAEGPAHLPVRKGDVANDGAVGGAGAVAGVVLAPIPVAQALGLGPARVGEGRHRERAGVAPLDSAGGRGDGEVGELGLEDGVGAGDDGQGRGGLMLDGDPYGVDA